MAPRRYVAVKKLVSFSMATWCLVAFWIFRPAKLTARHELSQQLTARQTPFSVHHETFSAMKPFSP